MNGGGGAANARPSALKLVALDVDGVLTDGRLHYGPGGEADKTFHVRDGLGLVNLRRAGVEVAVITGRGNAAVERRMGELGVEHVITQCEDKGRALDELAARLGIPLGAVAAVGDDLPDVPMLRCAGVAIAVGDAHPELRRVADWVTQAPGGRGAVREIADWILAGAGRFRVVIPARLGASRLPRKPLRDICGRPMIEHVWERAVEAGAEEVVVACDDDEICRAVSRFGGRAVLTAATHTSGTDRLAEVAEREGWGDGEVVVNLQGDEPLIPGALVATVAAALTDNPGAGIATMATPIRDVDHLFDPNVVKVVVDDRNMASYFSRAPIPWVRDVFAADGRPPSRPASLPDGVAFLRHIGLYAYRVGQLRAVAAEPPRPAERAESLEQLRALALGVDIHVTIQEKPPGHGVDTEADLARVERVLSATGGPPGTR